MKSVDKSRVTDYEDIYLDDFDTITSFNISTDTFAYIEVLCTIKYQLMSKPKGKEIHFYPIDF